MSGAIMRKPRQSVLKIKGVHGADTRLEAETEETGIEGFTNPGATGRGWSAELKDLFAMRDEIENLVDKRQEAFA